VPLPKLRAPCGACDAAPCATRKEDVTQWPVGLPNGRHGQTSALPTVRNDGFARSTWCAACGTNGVALLEIDYDDQMNTACPLCRSVNTFVLQTTEPLADYDPLVMTSLIAAGETLKFMTCQDCSLTFRSPRPSAEQVAHYYEHTLPPREAGHMKTMGVDRQQADDRNDRRYGLLFDDLRRLVKADSGHIIDIGGWDGRSLVPWRAAGWDTTLIDPGAAKRTLASPDIRAIGSIDDAVRAQLRTATLITSYHCIEHMLDIDGWAAESRRLSNADTVWVIEVPFDIIYTQQLLGPRPLKQAGIHPEHLNFFTPRSLRALAIRMGLEPKSVKIVITPYWFGPTISLRMIARRAPQRRQEPVTKPWSPRRVRASFTVLFPVWRRVAGLMFRYARLAHPEWG
jgi:hypothetical protein